MARSPRWRGRGTTRRTRPPKARLTPSIPTPIPPSPLLSSPSNPHLIWLRPSILSLCLLADSQLETNNIAMNIQVRTHSSLFFLLSFQIRWRSRHEPDLGGGGRSRPSSVVAGVVALPPMWGPIGSGVRRWIRADTWTTTATTLEQRR